MAKVQLNSNAQKLLKELIAQDEIKSIPRDRFDRVIQKPAANNSDVNPAVNTFKKISSNNMHEYLIRENLVDEFAEFISTKTASDTIIDKSEHVFNETLYNEDMQNAAIAIDEVQSWLQNAKSHLNMFSFDTVNQKIREFNRLRSNTPSRTDSKYLQDKVVTLEFSGSECWNRFLELHKLRENVIERHRKAQLAEWHSKRDLDISESDFKCLKQLFRLGQLNLESVPTEIIKKNCCMSWCRDYLRDALFNVDSVKAYNADESRFSMSCKDAEAEFESTAFVDDDRTKLSAVYASMNEFINLSRIKASLAEV